MAEARRRLVADLGGTHFRIALADADGTLHEVAVVDTRTVRDAGAVLADYWRQRGRPPLAKVAVCVAGPVDGTGMNARCRMTNVGLTVDAASLAAALGLPRALLVNDFAAVAAATPLLSADDLALHGASPPPKAATTVVLGPGTGLGVAAWLAGGTIVAGEGGHARLAAPAPEATLSWAALERRFGFVSAEHVLSGQGLVQLHRAVGETRGSPQVETTPAAIWQARLDGDGVAIETIAHFTRALGACAGDLALIFGARGVLLAGGILPRWGAGFDTALFRAAFEAKEPGYRERLAAIPSATVRHAYPALLGLAAWPD